MSEAEFVALRHTIAVRGTLRLALVPATFFMWAAVTTALVLFSELPVAALLSLSILAAGFEAINAVHVGVERIGRYLQVFYEETSGGEKPHMGGPRWETTAMQTGPALPGGGVDPLFTMLFLSAAAVNLIPSLLPQPTPVEITVVTALHLAFGARVVRARLAAAKQRAVDLAHYRELRLRERNGQ